MGDNWWNSGNLVGDYNGGGSVDPIQNASTDYQTGQVENLFNANTTYQPPGTAAPLDQYNYVPDPNAPGGYQEYGPGLEAPLDAGTYSSADQGYPNDAAMANAIANQSAYSPPTLDAMGNAGFNQQYSALGNTLGQMQYSPDQFANLPQETQDLFNNTYPGQGAQVWAQQANQNAAQAAGGGGVVGVPSTIPQLMYGSQFGGGTVAPSTPGSIGAGTAGIQAGWGVPYFGGPQQQITPQNWAVLSNPQLQQSLAPGYIPGSGTYNQYNLSEGNLFGNIAGVMSNLNYGVGGPGDPTNGTEPQTPQQWIQGDRLFTWQGNMGQTPGTEGLDYIATLFGRGDTPSGMGTPTFNAPDQYWQGLYQAIAAGHVQPTARGWQMLQQVRGMTPERIGGAAPAQAQSVGVTGGSGTGPMGAGTQAFNYQAAYLDYLTAMMNNVQIPGMQNQNQQFHDQLAFEQAKQKFLEQYQQQVFSEGQRQFDVNTGLQQGQLTGTYNGQDTLAKQQLNQQTSLGYLGLLGQLRGPGDIFQYLKVLNGTPGGIRDIVNAAAGAYRMPSFGGGATVGGANTGGGTDINTLLSQMNNPNYGAEGQNLNLPLPNQLNARALLNMTPSQQQTLMAAYESAGYRPEDVQAIFRNSLPQYAGQQSAGRVGLF